MTTLLLMLLLLLSGSAQAFVPTLPFSKSPLSTSTSTTTATAKPAYSSSLFHSIYIHKQTSSFGALQKHPLRNMKPQKMTTALQAHAVVGLGAIAGAISGGLFAGGLHAVAGKCVNDVQVKKNEDEAPFRVHIDDLFMPLLLRSTHSCFSSSCFFETGPDHLAALLPRCCGQRWFKAGRVGALWGMGHGVSATLLGVAAFALKNTLGAKQRAVLSSASHVTEIAVGLSLILIGAMGIKEAREWQDEIIVSPVVVNDNTTTPATVATATTAKSLSAAAADTGIKTAQKRAVIFNGLLHGFSWDGAPSLAPALAVATWSGNLAFLSAYAVGTMTTMAVTTTLIGEGTRKAGQFFQRPDIPQKLSMVSSFVAIAIGVIWCGLAVL